MKCSIIDTLIGIFAVDEGGNIISFRDFQDDNQQIIDFYVGLEKNKLPLTFEELLTELNNTGFDHFYFDNEQLKKVTSKLYDYSTSLDVFSLEFRNFRFNLQERVSQLGIIISDDDIKEKYKVVNAEIIKKQIKRLGAKKDVIVVQIIETLDLLKKSISNFSMRLREWYGLHFPELTDDVINDNITLAKLVAKIGERDNYNPLTLESELEIGEATAKALVSRAEKSMGSEIDLEIVKQFANQILSLDNHVGELEAYLEDLLGEIAPNMKELIGSLVGAKLIANAGSLKKLAYMPASRIQILGAEKALYRYLKTGKGIPKHGVIFQWQQIRGSKPWIRGKISRMVAGKIGLAAKVDHFKGDYMGDKLLAEVEEKIEKIKEENPEPPKESGKKQRGGRKSKKRRRK